jgi:hypothetical protein
MRGRRRLPPAITDFNVMVGHSYMFVTGPT